MLAKIIYFVIGVVVSGCVGKMIWMELQRKITNRRLERKKQENDGNGPFYKQPGYKYPYNLFY